MVIIKLLLLFAAGFVTDLLVTKYTEFVAFKKIGKATVLSGIITIVNFVLLTFVFKDGAAEGALNILMIAGGNSLGTFWALRH